MTKFKDMNAFEDLKTELSNEIAKNFVARLREAGVSDGKLNEVTANVCYDVASVINAVGDLDIPASTNIVEVPEKTSNDIYAMLLEKSDDVTATLQEMMQESIAEAPEQTSDDIYAMLLEKSDDINDMLQEKTDNFTAMLQEKTHENIEVDDENSNQEKYQVDGVMTQEKILQILNAAKSTSK